MPVPIHASFELPVILSNGVVANVRTFASCAFARGAVASMRRKDEATLTVKDTKHLLYQLLSGIGVLECAQIHC